MKIDYSMKTKLIRLLMGTLAAVMLTCSTVAVSQTTLYEEFGGKQGMSNVVDQFLWNLAEDERINKFFVETNISRFREKLFEFFCREADGPCEYTGDTMIRTHANLEINPAHFNAVVENLIHAMEDQDIGTGTQNQLLKRLAVYFKEVVKVPPVGANS